MAKQSFMSFQMESQDGGSQNQNDENDLAVTNGNNTAKETDRKTRRRSKKLSDYSKDEMIQMIDTKDKELDKVRKDNAANVKKLHASIKKLQNEKQKLETDLDKLNTE